MFTFTRNDVFGSDGWIPVNKKLAKAAGLEAAVIYGELTRKEQWYRDHDKLIDGEWFFVTEEDLEDSTTLKRRGQNKGINELVKLGLIEKKVKGLPAKRFFKIVDEAVILERTNKNVQNEQTDKDNGSGGQNGSKSDLKPQSDQVVQNEQTGMSKTDKLESPKCTGNNNNSNNNNINKNNINNLSINESKKAENIATDKKEEKTIDRNDSIEIQIEKMEVPMAIKKQLMMNIDRIKRDQIDIKAIETLYNIYHRKMNEHEIGLVLSNVLKSTKGKIHNIANIMKVSLDNFLKGADHEQAQTRKPIRTELLPDWFYKSEYENQDANKQHSLYF